MPAEIDCGFAALGVARHEPVQHSKTGNIHMECGRQEPTHRVRDTASNRKVELDKDRAEQRHDRIAGRHDYQVEQASHTE